MGDMVRFTRDKEARKVTAEDLQAAVAGLEPMPGHLLLVSLGMIEVEGGDVYPARVTTASLQKCNPFKPDPPPRNLPVGKKRSWEQATDQLRRMQIASLLQRSLRHITPGATPCQFTYAGMGQRVPMQAQVFADGLTPTLVIALQEEDLAAPKATSRKKK